MQLHDQTVVGRHPGEPVEQLVPAEGDRLRGGHGAVQASPVHPLGLYGVRAVSSRSGIEDAIVGGVAPCSRSKAAGSANAARQAGVAAGESMPATRHRGRPGPAAQPVGRGRIDEAVRPEGGQHPAGEGWVVAEGTRGRPSRRRGHRWSPAPRCRNGRTRPVDDTPGRQPLAPAVVHTSAVSALGRVDSEDVAQLGLQPEPDRRTEEDVPPLAQLPPDLLGQGRTTRRRVQSRRVGRGSPRRSAAFGSRSGPA